MVSHQYLHIPLLTSSLSAASRYFFSVPADSFLPIPGPQVNPVGFFVQPFPGILKQNKKEYAI